jgi:hypothetical protein
MNNWSSRKVFSKVLGVGFLAFLSACISVDSTKIDAEAHSENMDITRCKTAAQNSVAKANCLIQPLADTLDDLAKLKTDTTVLASLRDSTGNLKPPVAAWDSLNYKMVSPPNYLGGLEPELPLLKITFDHRYFMPKDSSSVRAAGTEECERQLDSIRDFHREWRENSIQLGALNIRYGVFRNGQWEVVHNHHELKALWAPVRSANAALSYAQLSTGYTVIDNMDIDSYKKHFDLENLVDSLELSTSIAVEGGYYVTMLDQHYKMGGCGYIEVSKVKLLVAYNGAIEELERVPVQRSAMQICSTPTSAWGPIVVNLLGSESCVIHF